MGEFLNVDRYIHEAFGSESDPEWGLELHDETLASLKKFGVIKDYRDEIDIFDHSLIEASQRLPNNLLLSLNHESIGLYENDGKNVSLDTLFGEKDWAYFNFSDVASLDLGSAKGLYCRHKDDSPYKDLIIVEGKTVKSWPGGAAAKFHIYDAEDLVRYINT
jgi:hypothetical protein